MHCTQRCVSGWHWVPLALPVQSVLSSHSRQTPATQIVRPGNLSPPHWALLVQLVHAMVSQRAARGEASLWSVTMQGTQVCKVTLQCPTPLHWLSSVQVTQLPLVVSHVGPSEQRRRL